MRKKEIIDTIFYFVSILVNIVICVTLLFLLIGRDRINGRYMITNEEMKKKLEAKKNDLPENVYEILLKIVDSNDESEKKYFNYVIDLPFKKSKIENNNEKEILDYLDKNFYGLKKLKKEIVTYLNRKKAGYQNKNLLFLGCPGVGKTSFAQAVAKALNREYVHIAMGGVTDEKKIRGYRKTYVGAGPGAIIKGIKECGYNNPLVLLDEIDKIENSSVLNEGNVSGALAEILDPIQKNKFVDNYLEFEFDLSNVLFIATANYGFRINEFIKNRFHVIEIENYSEEDLNKIFDSVIGPKKIEEAKLENVKFEDCFLKDVIKKYFKEIKKQRLEKEKCYKISVRDLIKIAEDIISTFKINFCSNNICKKKEISKDDFIEELNEKEKDLLKLI